MKKFPVTIVDNFYENPELVRDFALSQEFYSSDGSYPGLRTDLISSLNENFFNTFCHKVISLFYDFGNTKLSWNIETNFQKISKFSKNKDSKLNHGWVHCDNCIFSGVVYLSKNSSGTNIYYPKNSENFNQPQDQKHLLFSGNDVDESEYENAIEQNNSKFYESIKISGEFNRLVIFEGGIYHRVPSFYSENDDRLTQVFFVNEVNNVNDIGNYPIVRSKVR